MDMNFKARKRDKKTTIFIILMLAYPVIQFLVFWLGMNVSSFTMAFSNIGVNGETFVGWANFEEIFRSFAEPGNLIKTYCLNSLSLFPLIVFGIVPISLIFSYFLFKKVFLYKFYRVVFYLPACISAVVLTMLFTYMIEPQTGPVFKILESLGWISGEASYTGLLGSESTAWGTILVFSIWTGLSTNLVMFCSAMSRVPQEILESGNLDGAGMFTEMTSLIIPIIWPTVSTMIVMGMLEVFTWFMPSLLMTNGGPNGATGTIGLHIINGATQIRGKYEVASFGIMMTLIAAPILLTLRYFMNRLYDAVEV